MVGYFVVAPFILLHSQSGEKDCYSFPLLFWKHVHESRLVSKAFVTEPEPPGLWVTERKQGS